MLNIAKTGFAAVFAYRKHSSTLVFCPHCLTKTFYLLRKDIKIKVIIKYQFHYFYFMAHPLESNQKYPYLCFY